MVNLFGHMDVTRYFEEPFVYHGLQPGTIEFRGHTIATYHDDSRMKQTAASIMKTTAGDSNEMIDKGRKKIFLQLRAVVPRRIL